ncbi:MAG: WD40 repeat domain-containing protein [Chloroflexota bacterium]|nr:WD40 repeat domain-containing protein [Chloroflexota bacterium]
MPGLLNRPTRRGKEPRAKLDVTPIWHADIGDYVQGVAWSAEGDLAAASISGPIAIFDTNNDRKHEWPGHGFGTTAISWNRDGTRLASVGQDQTVKVYDSGSDEQLWEMPIGTAWCEATAWSPVDHVLATAAGRTLTLFGGDGSLIRSEDGHGSTISDLAWSPDGSTVAVTHYGGLTIWPVDPAAGGQALAWKGSSLRLAWSPNGAYIATGDQDSTVHFWETATSLDLQMWGYPTKVLQLAWHPSSRFLATGGGPSIVVWDCGGKGPENTTPVMLDGNEEHVSALAYRPDGSLLVSGYDDGRLCFWNPGKSKRPILALEPRPDGDLTGISQLSWSVDGQRLAVGHANGTVAVVGVG